MDSPDSPPSRRLAGHGDWRPRLLAGRREGESRRVPPDDVVIPRYAPDDEAALARKVTRKSGMLRPDERVILVVRSHPAALIGFIWLNLVALAVAGFLSQQVWRVGKNGIVIFRITLFHHVEKVVGYHDTVLLSIWVLWGLALLYLVYKVWAESAACVILTDRQIILTAGVLVRRFASVCISDVTSWNMRDSLGGQLMGYRSVIFESGGDDRVALTIGYIPFPQDRCIEAALPSTARKAKDKEVFRKWTPGGLRRRIRLIVAVLLVCLVVVLAVAAAAVPRIRAELSNETEIIALLPVLIVLIVPKP